MSLLVHSADGVTLSASEAVLLESRVLRDLYETEEGSVGEAPLFAPVCCAAELEVLFNLCPLHEIHKHGAGLRWTSEAEMAFNARVLHCAHYLDCPNLLAAIAQDFAANLVNASTTLAAAERFYAPEWAVRPLREWPQDMQITAQKLLAGLGRGSFIGTRAQVLAAAWASGDSALYALPQEICGAILEQADALCAGELGNAVSVLTGPCGCRQDAEAAFSKLEARRDQLLNSPLVISVAVAWALAPTSLPQTRLAALKALRAVCTFGDKQAFSAFLAAVDPKASIEPRLACTTQETSLRAVAFKALPIVIDKEDHDQVQAVVDAASENMLNPAEQVRAAAVACLGAVAKDPPSMFRFIVRTTGLDVLSDEWDLATRSMEDALQSSLYSADPKVRQAAAESIGVLVTKTGDMVAERIVQQLSSEGGILSSAFPDLRAAGVLALQHLMLVVQDPKGWMVLMNCLHDRDTEVQNTVRIALMNLAGIDGGPEAMLPLFDKVFHGAEDDVRTLVVDIVSAIANMHPLANAHICACHLASRALIDGTLNVRLSALKLLRALKGPQEAVTPVLDILKNGDEDSCLEASRALSAISPSHDPTLVEAMAAALANANLEEHVVEMVGILRKLANPRHDIVAASAFANLIKRRDERKILIVALKGLEAVAPLGHELARLAALKSMRFPQPDVVEAAVGAVKCVCYRGDRDAVAALIDSSQLHNVRPVALKALGVLSLAGEMEVLDLLRLRFDHGHWPVRAAALEAFGALAIHGCPEDILAVKGRLSDSSADVRHIAVDVLVKLAHPMEREVVNILVETRDLQPIQVQIAIDEGLEMLLHASYSGDMEQPDLGFDRVPVVANQTNTSKDCHTSEYMLTYAKFGGDTECLRHSKTEGVTHPETEGLQHSASLQSSVPAVSSAESKPSAPDLQETDMGDELVIVTPEVSPPPQTTSCADSSTVEAAHDPVDLQEPVATVASEPASSFEPDIESSGARISGQLDADGSSLSSSPVSAASSAHAYSTASTNSTPTSATNRSQVKASLRTFLQKADRTSHRPKVSMSSRRVS